MQSQRLRLFCESALTLALVLGWSASSSAATSIVSARNSSDPRARVFDGKLYLYTSSDLNQSGNWPMNKTYCYTLTDSSADPGVAANWTDKGAVLSESDYAWAVGENHLWAPDAFQGKDGKYYLYVPDTFGTAGGSHVGVSVSTSPTGPFAPPSGLTSNTNFVTAVNPYMSDPSVFADPNDANGQRYLVYADGDYNSTAYGCGHLSIGKLDPATGTLTGNQKIQFSNQASMPNAGGCTPAYIEGAELAYFGGAGADGNGKYFLYFAIKDNTSYTESIGYATADTVMGPYTYQGMVMSGQGGAGWTNQASIVEWQGHYLMFYHNDPKAGTNPNRQVFIECVGIKDGKISPVTRGTYKTLADCPKANTGTAGTGGATGGAGGAASTNPTTGGRPATGTGGALATGGTNGVTTGVATMGGNATAAGGAAGTGVVTKGGAAANVGGAAATGTVKPGTTTGTNIATAGSNGGIAGSPSGTGTSAVTDPSSDGCGCRIENTTQNRNSTRLLGVLVLGMLAFARRRRS